MSRTPKEIRDHDHHTHPRAHRALPQRIPSSPKLASKFRAKVKAYCARIDAIRLLEQQDGIARVVKTLEVRRSI